MANFYLSPSDQKGNVYKGVDTNEAIVCGEIAMHCEAALKRNGHNVMVGHYKTMAEKCKESDDFNATIHVPIHTNAFNNEVMGTRLFSYDNTGTGHKYAEKIFEVLAPLTPGTSENIKAAPHLYEVRTPKAPTVYIEVDFHDTVSGASWLASNTKQIGETIARGLCAAVGASYMEDTSTICICGFCRKCCQCAYNKGCDPC